MFTVFHIGFTGLLGLLYKLLKVFTSLAGFTSLRGLLYELTIFLPLFGFTGLLGLLHVLKIFDIFILVILLHTHTSRINNALWCTFCMLLRTSILVLSSSGQAHFSHHIPHCCLSVMAISENKASYMSHYTGG